MRPRPALHRPFDSESPSFLTFPKVWLFVCLSLACRFAEDSAIFL